MQNCQRPETKPILQCNFKNGDYCGWSQLSSPLDDADWLMIDAISGPVNATAGTGTFKISPYYDHHLYFESSGLKWNSTAAIFSPVYLEGLLKSGVDACFAFLFSMNGANMGSLSLFVMPENDENFIDKTPLISFQGNKVIITNIVSTNRQKSTRLRLSFRGHIGSTGRSQSTRQRSMAHFN